MSKYEWVLSYYEERDNDWVKTESFYNDQESAFKSARVVIKNCYTHEVRLEKRIKGEDFVFEKTIFNKR